MTDELDESMVDDFIRLLHNEYDKRSKLGRMCNKELYVPSKHDAANQSQIIEETDEFIQIPRRILLPVDIVHSEFADMSVKNLIRSISLGERNYVVSELSQKVDSGEVSEVHLDDLEYNTILEASKQVRGPDLLVLPSAKEVRNKVFDWKKSGNYFFRNKEVIILGGNVVELMWVPTDIATDGVLINSNRIEIIQKLHGDSTTPKNFNYNGKFEKYSRNRPLMTYFGEEVVIDDEEENEDLRQKVDFLYRTVVSPPELEQDSALYINLPETL